MENAIARCDLPGKNKEHVTYFTPHWLYIILGNKKWRFSNESVSNIQFDHHKLLMPLIGGGLSASLAILVIIKNLFDPFWALVFLLSGIFLLYYGWMGSEVIIINEGQNATKIYVRKISKNLKEYFNFYRTYCINQMQDHIIYHIAQASEWIEGKPYSHPSLEKEGFIHASKKAQVTETFDLYFPPGGEYRLLEIDSFKLTSELKYEEAPSRSQSFPHIYGPINSASVRSAGSFRNKEELIRLLNQ